VRFARGRSVLHFGRILEFRQELHQSFIGGGIDRRRGNFDLQFVTQDLADGIFRGAGLHFDRQIDAFGAGLEKRWHATFRVRAGYYKQGLFV